MTDSDRQFSSIIVSYVVIIANNVFCLAPPHKPVRGREHGDCPIGLLYRQHSSSGIYSLPVPVRSAVCAKSRILIYFMTIWRDIIQLIDLESIEASMIQIGNSILLCCCNSLDPDQVAALKEIKAAAPLKLSQGQSIKIYRYTVSILFLGDMGCIPLIHRLFYLIPAARGIIGIGVPLISQNFSRGKSFGPLGIIFRTFRGDHLKLWNQIPGQNVIKTMGFISQFQNTRGLINDP